MLQTATDADFESLLKSNPKVVVKYYADWCGSCKLFAPKFKRIANDEANAGILFLDINAEENENARKLAGVDNLPFLATFKDGILVEGAATSKEEYLLKMINDIR
ncbi:MAG: thioredoxin family protein [Bacteroidetes bacterium]|nr:thioredoxin family protein [Bacteroidota bacterium]